MTAVGNPGSSTYRFNSISDTMELQAALLLLLIGLLAGITSGFVGIGGGLIIVPALIYFLGMSQHSAQGTSLAMMLPPVGILAVMSYARAGHVHYTQAALLAITFFLGAYWGSKWSLRISPHWVRLIFAGILFLSSLQLGYKAIGALLKKAP